MINLLFNILIIWADLNILALFLISLRKDKQTILKDVALFLIKKHYFYLTLIDFIIVFIMMPLTIPYSISYLIKKK